MDGRKSLLARLNSIKMRCLNPRHIGFQNYGGRGIRVCQEWLTTSESFIQWALASGFRPGMQIDRIDCDGDYSPDNCRWVDHYENQLNRREVAPSKTKSRYVGVRLHESGLWEARARWQGKQRHLGYSKTEEGAFAIYREFVLKTRGKDVAALKVSIKPRHTV